MYEISVPEETITICAGFNVEFFNDSKSFCTISGRFLVGMRIPTSLGISSDSLEAITRIYTEFGKNL